MRGESRQGLTLTELVTTIALFMLFSLILYNFLIFGLRFGRNIDAQSDLSGIIRKVRGTISSEFREAFGFQPRESMLDTLRNITPHLPNPSTPSSEELFFTIPDYTSLDLGTAILALETPENLLTIHYLIENKSAFCKEIITYKASGDIARTRRVKIFTLKEETLKFKASYISTDRMAMSFSILENDETKLTLSFHVFSENKRIMLDAGDSGGRKRRM